MKIVQFSSVGGASGDMILAALADLGVDLGEVERALQALDVAPLRLLLADAESHGLHGRRVEVRTSENQPEEEHAHGHHHDDHHDHHHDHHHEHGHTHEAHAPHRGLTEIRALIEQTALPEAVKRQAIAVFTALGKAEATVHRQPLEKIHFHEVGALDSIADIVGGCYALHLLGVDRVAVGPLPLGQGTVRCQHGVYPVPAPATTLLLMGQPTVQTDVPHELVTPTGAALLTTWKSDDAPPPGSRMLRVGYGFGHRQLGDRPNVLRATLLEVPTDVAARESCLVLECNLDDCTPEIVGALTRRLQDAGALDVFTVPAYMKKQRPGVLLTLLAKPEDREKMLDLLFRESTTLGVRESMNTRTVLPRETKVVETPYGAVRIKQARWQGTLVTAAPEMEDCEKRSAEHGVSVRLVYEAAQRLAGIEPVS